MAPKRKASGVVQGAAKTARSSAVPTPEAGTPRSIGSDDDNSGGDELDVVEDENIEKMVDKFSIERDSRRYANGRDFASHIFRDSSGVNRDFSYLSLKPDHHNRPLWIDPDKGNIILESLNPLAAVAQDFLITIAEPLSRPTFLHEYALTIHSLYAAVSVGLSPQDIINTLDRLLKMPLPDTIRRFIESCTQSYGKIKLVLKNVRYFVESADPEMLQKLLKDEVIGPLRIHGNEEITATAAPEMASLIIPGTDTTAVVRRAGLGVRGQPQPQPAAAESETIHEGDVYVALNENNNDDDQEEIAYAFEIADGAVETVQRRCLELKYPVLEEYDFQEDEANANLEIDLKPGTQIRPYQEMSLSKMFGNGRAKSGIIVLPCGAGKTLVGITAACTIKKGVIVLCTSSMSVVQWRQEFLKWSNINPDDIEAFTSDNKGKTFSGDTGIIVTTYSMVAQTGERSHEAKKMMDFISNREWGLMILDEVHVVPANIFRRVTSRIKTHSKLGLSATLLREDDKISDLNYLIGPKLYEANWMELSEQGHIAKVQCAEVWCPMPIKFYDEYLRAPASIKRTLCAMNPHKFQACQHLINYHEARGDKIIVFSDELYSLKQYALKLGKAFIYGSTGQQERMRILENFQHNPLVNTLFLSKIGDTSLDLPEATCLIQISSHFGSRRQEAQRLGRILRAKRRNDEGFNAFFYSLVSKDTQEMYYSSKRQAFLVDQGYAFKVITHLAKIEKTPDLAFATEPEQRELLQRTLVDNKKGVEEDIETDDLFNSEQGGSRERRKGAVRQTAGALGEPSGAQDMAYIEQNKAVNKMQKKKKKAELSSFFKNIAREKERRKRNL